MMRDPRAAPHFLGVYPVNLLPFELVIRPSSLIINLDPHYKGGSHWICIYFPKRGVPVYFDSFGGPATSQEIITFLERNSKYGYIYNPYTYQSYTSSTCGYWCILVLSLLHRSFTLNEIHSFFLPYMGVINDFLLLHFVNVVQNIIQ